MYIEISIDEMRDLLKESKGWVEITPNGNQERMFDFLLSDGPQGEPLAIIRVYSSIASESVSRAVGKDAIRVCVLDAVYKKGVRKFPRVTRQENWSKHLQSRVMEAYTYVKKSLLRCPTCGNVLAIREPKKDQNWSAFMSCINPDCNYTYNY